MTIHAKKICVIGDFAVGKTSLINRYINQAFNHQYHSTVGIKISQKWISVSDRNTRIRLMIWDIEGSTASKSIDRTYFQGAAGAILVGDITRPKTLDHLEANAQQFLQVNPGGKLVVAFNKVDLLDRTQFNQIENRYDLRHLPQWLASNATSAKDGIGIEQTFQQLAIALVDTRQLVLA